MIEQEFLSDFFIAIVVATSVAVLFDRLRLPSLLGFLLAGVAVGPKGFGWVSDIHQIRLLADLGVILLMLTIGLEFSFDRMKGFHRLALIGGGLQLLLSIGVGVAYAWLVSWPLTNGLLLGAVIALSSTAIVLKYLMDRGELDTPYGRIGLAILLFQDLAVVPLMILIREGGSSPQSFVAALGGAILRAGILFAVALVTAKFLIPRFLKQIALMRNREMFFLSSLVICLGTAWLGNAIGLSYAVGAFFAGLMMANTDYGHQFLGDIVPLRYIFVSLFFVSIGLLFDVGFAVAHFGTILKVVGLVLAVNFVLVTIIVSLFGYPPRIALSAGLILSQIGEFSFLLLEASRHSGKIDENLYQLLLSAAFITLFLTPFLFALLPFVLRLSEEQPFFGFHPRQKESALKMAEPLTNHVIVCGYGPIGRDLAQSLDAEEVPYILIEMNPRRVAEARKNNVPVIYGDAANMEVISRAGVDRAKMIVLSLGDPVGVRQIVRIIQRLNPNVHLVLRTRFDRDVANFYEWGADSVVMEEWEAGYEMHRIVLDYLNVPPDRVKKHLARIVERKEWIIEQAIFGHPKSS